MIVEVLFFGLVQFVFVQPWCPWTLSEDGNCFRDFPPDAWADAEAACLALGLAHGLSGHLSDVWQRVEGNWIGLNRITGHIDFSNGLAVSPGVRDNIISEGSGLCGYVSGGKIRYDDCSNTRAYECRFTQGSNAWDNGVYDIAQETYVCDFHALECPEKYSVCFGLRYDDYRVCHGGLCEFYDQCNCDSVVDSSEDECHIVCNGVRTGKEPLFLPCGEYGVCLFQHDTNRPGCVCSEGYFGSECEPTCFGIPASSNVSCSGHGVCQELDVCLCNPDDDLVLNDTSCAYHRALSGRAPSVTVSAIVAGAATIVILVVVASAAVYLVCKHREIEHAKNQYRESDSRTRQEGGATNIELPHLRTGQFLVESIEDSA